MSKSKTKLTRLLFVLGTSSLPFLAVSCHWTKNQEQTKKNEISSETPKLDPSNPNTQSESEKPNTPSTPNNPQEKVVIGDKKAYFYSTLNDMYNTLELQRFYKFGLATSFFFWDNYNQLSPNITKLKTGEYNENTQKEFEKLKSKYDTFQNDLEEKDRQDGKNDVTFDRTWTKEDAIQNFKETFKKLENAKAIGVKYDVYGEFGLTNDVAYEALQEIMKSDDFPSYLSLVSEGSLRFDIRQNRVARLNISNNNLTEEGKKAQKVYIDNAMKLISNPSMTTLEKVYVLGKYVVENLNYVIENASLNNAYTSQKGVCKEYVDQFAHLLSRAKIKYRIQTGDAHTWLSIQLDDNKWIYSDPTFADDSGENIIKAIGKSGTSETDKSAITQLFRTQSSAQTDQKMFGLITPTSENIENVINDEYINKTFIKLIKEVVANGKQVSSLNYYENKFYFLEKEGNKTLLKYIDTKAKEIKSVKELNDTNKLALFVNDSFLYYVKGKELWKIDLKNSNSESKVKDFTSNIETIVLVRNKEKIQFQINNETYEIN
ncbi:hypothetical protein NPL7_00525 [Metamycoplasma hyosynoviae]|uniref:transglutaminase domain-containing protein n=1 Tax=Metamycoplasma hyosynoviae TaxID=29559 RepID=UPI000461D0B0|nr:transglutaminase domain-containing protein [Metamycoplasma hyosynoviae]KDE42201.1 hypothetical protein NPL3_02180 [Metamycoplasma hyosynoviae]KDE42342.1 hypothetical protein NPL7_00525 [Metamycoplasma hyosynoviae]KDE43987.1 hypothetical protein NPL6_02940 [Metamycoplasma hyosynoviae]KDE44059.1 hypothetical protein NPL5_00665 [Metamycoplasma hyosynoviae]MDD7895258.1 transglutaminase-like domain-containing protein [Metamycoplasma hyosynoviae]